MHRTWQGKNKEWKCRGCHQRWTCPVTNKLRAHILKVQGKDIRLCIKSYSSSQEVEAKQLLDTKLAEVTNAQKKQRVEDQSDPLLDPGTWNLYTGCTCLTAVWHFTTACTHPCLRTCTHTSLPAQRQLTHSGSLLPQRQLTFPSMAIAERHNKANLQLRMLFYGGCGIPFNVSRSPLFKRALQSVAEAGPGFKPVSYNALRGSMLDKVRYGHSFTAEPCFVCRASACVSQLSLRRLLPASAIGAHTASYTAKLVTGSAMPVLTSW